MGRFFFVFGTDFSFSGKFSQTVNENVHQKSKRTVQLFQSQCPHSWISMQLDKLYYLAKIVE